MKQIKTAVLTTIVFLLASHGAFAQMETSKISGGFGIEGGTAIHISSSSLRFSTVGITGRISIALGPGYVTGTTGVMVLIPSLFNSANASAGFLFPVKGGYKLILGGKFFVMAEAGYSFVRGISLAADPAATNSYGLNLNGGGFTVAPAIGLQHKTFEVSIRYEITTLTSANISFAAARVGWNF